MYDSCSSGENMMESIKMVKEMALASITIQTGLFTRNIWKMNWDMDLESWLMKMEEHTKENGSLVTDMAMYNKSLEMEFI